MNTKNQTKDNSQIVINKNMQKIEAHEFLLSQLNKNQQAIIDGYDTNLDTKTKRRLLELGFVQGKKITLEQVSILGDVLLVEINGYLLSLRTNIAKHILIKQISNKESV